MQGYNEDDEEQNDPTEFLALKSKSYIQLASKHEQLKKQVIQLYQNVMLQCTDIKTLQIPNPFQQIQSDRKGNYDAQYALQQVQTLISTALNVSKNICAQLAQRDNQIESPYDDTLLRLEREVRNLLRSEEKLKIYVECQQIRVEEMKKRDKQQEFEVIDQKKSIGQRSPRSLVENLKASFKLQSPLSQSINLNGNQKTDEVKKSNRLILSAVSQQNNQDGLTQKKSLQQMSGSAMLVDRENKKLRQQIQTAFKGKEMEQQKMTFDIKRMMIRIEDLEKENRYLRKEIIDLNLQTSKLKDEKLEEEKQKLYKEATSDKNPNLIDFYRNKNIEKDKNIKSLNKNLKKFAVVEKKIFVKEKAFEVERAEYQGQLLYLNERVNKMQKQIVQQFINP